MKKTRWKNKQKPRPPLLSMSATTDEMQEIFAQLDEGMEEMDKNFHVSELQRNTGAAANER